jgi:hypothetical protein
MGKAILRAILVLGTGVTISGRAGAQAQAFYSGNDLNNFCNHQPGSLEAGICGGYIVGIADALGATDKGVPLSIAGWRACIPTGVSRSGQVVDIVTKWLRESPQHLHYPAPSLVAAALAEAFPCRANGG